MTTSQMMRENISTSYRTDWQHCPLGIAQSGLIASIVSMLNFHLMFAGKVLSVSLYAVCCTACCSIVLGYRAAVSCLNAWTRLDNSILQHRLSASKLNVLKLSFLNYSGCEEMLAELEVNPGAPVVFGSVLFCSSTGVKTTE